MSVPVTADPLYQQGARLWNAGRPFEAHEHFEAAWRRGTGTAERAIFQGLVQYAAAWVKLRAGNRSGFASNAGKAAANLAAVPSSAEPALTAWRDAMLVWAGNDEPGEPPPSLP